MLGEILLPFTFGIDPFTYKKVPELEVTGTFESLGAKSKFIAQRLIPNNPILSTFGDTDSFSSWSYKKIYKSVQDVDSPYAETLPVFLAVAQTLGLKLWPFEPAKKSRQITAEFKRRRNVYTRQIDNILKKKTSGRITDKTATEEIIALEKKIEKEYLKYYKKQY